MRDIFTSHYQNNFWADDESVSGHGSTLEATKVIRQALPVLFARYGINSVLDLPCGDLNWSRLVNWPETYIGADIVPQLIADRDLFGHLSNKDVKFALRNIKRSGAKYLLATTFPGHQTNGDIHTGDWRPINLASFFGLPNPIEYINEGCTAGKGQFSDKSLGLWRIN